MARTLADGDEVSVAPLSGTLLRGSLIVSNEASTGTTRHLVKRVVAVGGETIEISGCHVLINGAVLNEPYLDPEVVTPDNCGGDTPLTDGPVDSVYVLGDNRGGSLDSRNLGPIPLSSIEGVVVAIRASGQGWTPAAE